ncbi:hypothetical protein niasHS_013179 [Heterodera schachtii]|uniref:Uncharacterized protein n=1 Tax=Heterodera schachtii TaxID=97005 RepID=A0ABD2IIW7_HETSC
MKRKRKRSEETDSPHHLIGWAVIRPIKTISAQVGSVRFEDGQKRPKFGGGSAVQTQAHNSFFGFSASSLPFPIFPVFICRRCHHFVSPSPNSFGNLGLIGIAVIAVTPSTAHSLIQSPPKLNGKFQLAFNAIPG